MKERYGELSTGIRVEDHHDFMFELKIANERSEAYEIAYAEEKSTRESVEERVEGLLDFYVMQESFIQRDTKRMKDLQ